MDDFDGSWQLETMLQEVRRAFPDRYMAALPEDHPAMSTLFELDSLDGMTPYVPGGEITYFGLHDETGRLAIAAGHNNDLANFWDWYENGRMPLEPAADAFRLGLNFVLWSMTH